jgi:chromosome segregation ATPase
MMGWFNTEEEKQEVTTMRELQKSLREQIDLYEDDAETKQSEINDAEDRVVQAQREVRALTSELQVIDDEKFRTEKALAALKTSKSAFYATRGNRRG